MFDRKFFFNTVRGPLFVSLSGNQVTGMESILGGFEQRYSSGDPRHLAYMLATAYHETAKSMQPIHEAGGAAYFTRRYDILGQNPALAKRLENTHPGDGALFHGRGFVQLTGRRNYTLASRKLGFDFVNHPELALDPTHAANIMFLGMSEGWFTGKKLADYFNDNHEDQTEARRIINGTDCAEKIAGYYDHFCTALGMAA